MSEQPARKLFTVAEANQRLPLVRAIVADIVSLFGDIQERRLRLAGVRKRRGESTPGRLYLEELEQIEDELHKDEERLAEFVAELQQLGIEFKDPSLGLVDFPALMDDRVVYLCWKLGESEVSYWHELDDGFAGRQSLLESSLCSHHDATEE